MVNKAYHMDLRSTLILTLTFFISGFLTAWFWQQ